jgi:2-succinyl-5-enolpyruvyl-6-hydroxy-3-cyclohexene-1-carboxylate synthase
VVVVCTSGTAAYNLAPAVAEAFFSETSLVIITADRPAEWVAQHDGQTIFQSEIFGKHVKRYFQLPQTYEHADDHWAINRIVNDAINLSQQDVHGPVHINAPFREPLYPTAGETITYSKPIRIIRELLPSWSLDANAEALIREALKNYHRVLVVAGQQDPHDALVSSLRKFLDTHKIPVITDVISNLHELPEAVRHGDLFLGQAPDEVKKTLQPDLLITFGQSLISKNVKLFLRHYAPKAHWHLQPAGLVADTFKNLTQVFRVAPASFFNFVSALPEEVNFENQKQQNYCKLWEVEERRSARSLAGFFSDKELSELEVVSEVLRLMPADANLHLANSMSVRYANFFGLEARQKGIRVFSNRGTSGIDGCTSTTVGHYFASGKPTFLITGDLAFFYDRNAFWHNYPLNDIRILLLNNHGGLIFDMIDGPGNTPEAAEYFVTRQKLNARKLCEEYGIEHLALDSRRKLKNILKDFFEFDGKTKILELDTDTARNKSLFENLKLKIKKSYEL